MTEKSYSTIIEDFEEVEEFLFTEKQTSSPTFKLMQEQSPISGSNECTSTTPKETGKYTFVKGVSCSN